ncbi:putative F-box/LRR-repeat protein 23 [Miscanthus floridulus]|uniref:putative F-box/LRR-repeat protein 23 n=1 Tax=Miscanthus floridulus TaxID=154761 RepID=UPI0034584FC3
MKHFRLSNEDFNVTRDWNKNKDVGGIAGMHGLRALQLFGNGINNEGLETILDSCPHLESLDIRHCFSVDMDETLLLKNRLRSQEYLNDSDSGDDTDFFGEPSRYECDLDKYDRMLPMSMRTFLK